MSPGPRARRRPPGWPPRRRCRRPYRRRPGCRLSIVDRDRTRRRRRARRASVRRGRRCCDASVGTSDRVSRLVAGDGDRTRVRRGDGDLVAQPDRLVDRRQRVEAVRTHRPDAEVQVDLGGRGRPDPRRAGHRAASPSAIRAKSSIELLAALPRVDAGAHQGLLGGRRRNRPGPPERGAQRLAPLGERGVDDREHLGAGDRHLRRVPVLPGDQTGVDVGGRPEDRPADGAGPPDLGEPGRLHRRHAVGARARRRRQPVRDLGLHHHQPVTQRRQQGHQVQQHRHGDVVGQVGHQRGRRRDPGTSGPAGRRRATTSKRSAWPGARSAMVAGSAAASTGSTSIGHDPVDRLQQGQGQRAQAGADLDDHVVGADARRADDAPDGVGVDDEVLAALLGRPQVEGGGQRTDIRRPEKPRTGGGHVLLGGVAHAGDTIRHAAGDYRGRPSLAAHPARRRSRRWRRGAWSRSRSASRGCCWCG